MELNSHLKLISKFSGYFHDGTIHKIVHKKNEVTIYIESAQILPEWEWDRKNLPISKRDTISGKLHLVEIKKIKENDQPFNDILKITYDVGDLFDLEIKKNHVNLLVTWLKQKPPFHRTDMISIEIEAEKIYWENVTTLFDAYWEGKWP